MVVVEEEAWKGLVMNEVEEVVVKEEVVEAGMGL